jgi:cytochrome c
LFPDGAVLPAGRCYVAAGEVLFAARCAACHGPAGIGGVAPELAHGRADLTAEWPDKTIGTYWPFATTLFAFVRRAMPLEAPGSLTDDEVYALTAYLLHLNCLVGADAVIDAAVLAAIRMPNRDGFVPVDALP